MKAFVFIYLVHLTCAVYDCNTNGIVNLTLNKIGNISSSYNENYVRKNPCQWKFAAPDGCGFKIVLKTFNVSSETELRIRNTTNIVVNERSVKTYHPYYNEDRYIEIYLSKGNSISEPQIGLIAYITVVKKDFETIYNKCSIAHVGNDITYWRSNEYMNNMYCKYEFIIPPNFQITILTSIYSVETGVDYVQYLADNNTAVIFSNDSPQFNLHSFDYNRHILFEFSTDGSVQYANGGFLLMFTKTSCKCDYSTLECDSNVHRPMKNSFFYCGKLKCNLTIKNCPTNYGLMNIMHLHIDDQGWAGQPDFDVFRVISNTETVLEINIMNSMTVDFNVYLNSSMVNIFEILTFPIHGLSILSYSLQPFIAPSVNLRVYLSSENPFYIMDTGLINISTVEIIKPLKNISIILYSSSSNGVSVYEDESLRKSLNQGKCFADMRTCDTKRRKIAIFNYYINVAPDFSILVVQLSEKPDNCVFNKNVFTPNDRDFLSVSAVATKNGTCHVFILLTDDITYFISHLFTSSTTENVKVFVGINHTNPFFEFNSKTAEKWKDIRLLTAVYTVEIPKNSAIYLTLERIHNSSLPVPISQTYYKTIIATPNYGISKMNTVIGQGNFVTYEIGNYSVKFTALNYNIQAPDKLTFILNDTIKYINKTSEFLVFRNQFVTLNYTYENGKKIENGALFLIETLPSL